MENIVLCSDISLIIQTREILLYKNNQRIAVFFLHLVMEKVEV